MDHRPKSKITKLTDNNGKTVDDFGYGDVFFDNTKARSMKETVDNLNFIKNKNFCCAKDKLKTNRRQATD